MDRTASEGRWVVGQGSLRPCARHEHETLLPHDGRASIVRRIFDLYVEDRLGSEAIAQLLNSEGLATKTGVPFSTRTVIHMLSNPIYVGKVVFKDNTYPGLHESLVDDDIFAAARLLTERGVAGCAGAPYRNLSQGPVAAVPLLRVRAPIGSPSRNSKKRSGADDRYLSRQQVSLQMP
jgi:hypothetical protein